MFTAANLNQDAMYWAAAGYAADGTRSVATGIPIRVRWEYRHEDVLDADGTSIRSDVTVMLDRVVENHSLLWLGHESSLPSDLTDITDLYEVISFRAVPTIDARQTQRTAMLIRYKNTFPTIV